MQRCCMQALFENADQANTHSILQQLLGEVDCTDDSRPPAASTAMTVTARLLAEVKGWACCIF